MENDGRDWQHPEKVLWVFAQICASVGYKKGHLVEKTSLSFPIHSHAVPAIMALVQTQPVMPNFSKDCQRGCDNDDNNEEEDD